jgi:septum formation protein
MNKLKKILSRSYILASRSPRRIHLLKQIGLNFRSIDPCIEELEEPDHNPIHTVKHNSLEKSRKVAFKHNNEIVIGADTVVCLDKMILNKPASDKQATDFLKLLSDRKHFVYTGINLINTSNGNEIFDYEKTEVRFRKLEDDEIRYYVKNYSPLDKAGAYGIQDDFGCLFIKKINGDFYNVVGLPLVKLYENLKKIV